jgi:hypothetical protein
VTAEVVETREGALFIDGVEVCPYCLRPAEFEHGEQGGPNLIGSIAEADDDSVHIDLRSAR